MTLKRYLWNWVFHPSRRPLYFVGFFILTFSWLTGLLDHFQETSFEEFSWPASSPDVFRETHKMAIDGWKPARVENSFASFPVLHSPRCAEQKYDLPYNLLIIVKSAVTNSKNRDVIRETWGKEHVIDDFTLRTVFVVGRFPNDKEHLSMKGALERESQLHGDLLVADMADTYRNNTAKFLYSLRYAFSPGDDCPRADFVLLIDDDYMLSTHNLIRLLDQKSSGQMLYEGFRFDSSPFRFRLHKHHVSLENYPFDRYPPYISAGAVLLSKATVDMFYHGVQLVKMYPFDDVFAGILAHLLRIRPIHNEGFVFWPREISHEEWLQGQVVCAHGYDPQTLSEQYPLVRFIVSG